MDRIIEKKKWTTKKIGYVAIVAVIVVLAIWGLGGLNKKTFNLDTSRISIKKVTQANFQDIILIDGEVEPISTVLVNSTEGGAVEQIYVEDGTLVQKGAPLLKLSNPGVLLNYLNQETAIVEQINNLQNLKLSLNKDQRNLSESLLDVEYILANAERSFTVDTQLYNGGVIARNDYFDSEEEYKYQQKKRDFLRENVSKTTDDNKIQIKRINRSIELMERNLEFIHESVQKLLVRAPITGRLSSFDPILGESYASNQNIGKIDVLKGYKIKGSVDEFYLSTVKAGQKARFSFDSQIIELEIKKVLPEVINGKFEIELLFVDDAPSAIRTGLSMQVRLELSKASEAILIPRGNYFHSSGGQYVFVLTQNNQAVKRYINIGRQNPSHYEVLEGLNEGEEIITSSYETFNNYDIVNLTK